MRFQGAEQDGSGNGGQRPSFAALCKSSLRRATPLTLEKDETPTHHSTIAGYCRAGRMFRD
jgi:hypothetical protein